MKVTSQRRYDSDFKRQAVDLVLRSGRPVSQVARELGVPHWALRDWKNKHLEQDGKVEQNIGSITAADLQQENVRLRRELEYAQRQRDILKKALGILSEEPLKRGMP
jgi:transposase